MVINPQMCFGQVDISQIKLDPKSRDDIPQILKGLQLIYADIETREAIFALLKSEIAPEVSHKNGRPGMELWKILVLGSLRVNLNLNYDRLQEFANKHDDIKSMLGHANNFDKYYYELQTLKDNVELLTPELLDKINQLVIKCGYKLVKKKEQEHLHGRVDSFVVETNVHFPTDINLLLDGMRTVIRLSAELCDIRGVSDWRQSSYNIRCMKKLERAAQNSKKSKSTRAKTSSDNDKIKSTHIEYINASQSLLNKAKETLNSLKTSKELRGQEIKIAQNIETFIAHSNRQIDQINRRVILGETIPHAEKVFSLFKPYTEWISKGKAGVPVELGVRVCIMEDQYQFILHHKVMQKQTDDQVAVEMVKETKERFGKMLSSSFDKGFHSPANQEALKAELELVVLPRKGKLSKIAREAEQTEDFKARRRQHSAVESAINALEVHGLDYCPDYGIERFERYVALAVLGRNIQLVGVIARNIERKQQKKQKNKALKKSFKAAA